MKSPSAFSTSCSCDALRTSLCRTESSLRKRGSAGSITPTAEISIVPGGKDGGAFGAGDVGGADAAVPAVTVAGAAGAVTAFAASPCGRGNSNQIPAPMATAANAAATATAGTRRVRAVVVPGVESVGGGVAVGAGFTATVLSAAMPCAFARKAIVASAPAADSVVAAARRAAANSSASAKRSSGRLASARRTTASNAGRTWTLRIDGGSGSSFSTFCTVVVADPVNGRSPVRNWYRMTPAANRSERPSTGRPSICSGDM
jgi:hypothetical protein